MKNIFLEKYPLSYLNFTARHISGKGVYEHLNIKFITRKII